MERRLLRGKNQMREIERRGAHEGGGGAPGVRGPRSVELGRSGWARSRRGSKSHGTHDH
jgi:hypothetical protein